MYNTCLYIISQQLKRDYLGLFGSFFFFFFFFFVNFSYGSTYAEKRKNKLEKEERKKKTSQSRLPVGQSISYSCFDSFSLPDLGLSRFSFLGGRE